MSRRPSPREGGPPLVPEGRSLSSRDFERAVGAVDFTVEARYEWDAGVAVGRYLDGLRAGKILGRECRRCRRILVPPRMFCEECFRPTDAWRQAADTGRVNTFSICYVSWDMQRLAEPEIPAVIEIDGASAGMGFMHKLGEVDPDRVSVGMEVEAVWKPEGDREGSILDIAYFRPKNARLRRTASGASRARKPRKRASGRHRPRGDGT